MASTEFRNLDLDTTLGGAAASDTTVSSQKAIKTYVDNSIPTVNNPTVTITQGGTTKGSFTLNQNSDATIALDSGGSVKNDVSVNAIATQYAVSASNTEISSATTWTAQTSPLNTRQRGVVYGNGYYVTIGASGSLAYSTDGSTWTSITPFCSGTLTGITYGNGYFLVVEYETKKVWKANLPTDTWSTVYTAASSLESIQYINSRFVITGESGLIAISDDGENWTAKTTGVSVNLIKATYGNGLYVVVGASGTILTSINGDTWTPRTSGISTDLRTVTYGNGKFIAGGKTILYSADGITWTETSTIPESITGWIREFTYGEKRYYAALYTSAGYGQIWYSENGIFWTKVLNLTTANTRLWDCTYGNGLFLSSGDNGSIYTLDLGIVWYSTVPAIPVNSYLWYRNVISQSDGSKVYSDAGIWYYESGDPLPDQTGNAGKFLTTNGTTASWAAVEIDDLTITTNSNDELQAVGVINQNVSGVVKTWTGTLAEYNALPSHSNDTQYIITDDEAQGGGATLTYDALTETLTIS